MLRKVVSIAGKPGLYSLVSQGKNMLIVESLADGKRVPAYARDKVMSLGDIAIYTTDDDMPLGDVLDKVFAYTEGKAVDVKSFANDAEMREYFGKILSEFDSERVYNNDIRKLFSWYNILLAAGFTKFAQELESAEKPTEEPEQE